MQKFFISLYVLISCWFMQINIFPQAPNVQEIIDLVKKDSLMYFVRELSGDIPTIINGTSQTILSRYSYHPDNELAMTYIKQKFDFYGLNTTIQNFNTNGQNVLAIQPGVEFPNVKYIIGAHYDAMSNGITYPGADDNASGVAAVIEAARILSQYSFPITILYAAWDQEEQGLLGSIYYVQQAIQTGDSILGVINLDMISYDSNSDYKAMVNVRPVVYSMFLKDKILEINNNYNIGLNLEIINPAEICCSDHAPFWYYNYSAIYLQEDGYEFNPFYHTVNDLVQYINPEYFLKNSKLGIGTMADLSMATIYGIIMAIDSYVDKTYARNNVDSVLFLTKFRNIYSHPFTANLIYANNGSTKIDSLTLFDDGLHGDSIADDGIYGVYILPQQDENFYSLSVSTIENESNKYFNATANCKFTTAGPLVVDSLFYVHFPKQKSFSTMPYLTNLGAVLPISNATVKIECEDSWIKNFPGTTVSFSTIQPGKTLRSSQVVSLLYDSTSFPGYFNLKFEIMSGGYCYWKDSLKFTPIISGIEEEGALPTDFALLQNYPNPFNPSTKISWQSPVGSHQTLKVYDVLGNEVVTLVNEYKPAGRYEVEFSVAQSAYGGSRPEIASGIYFYQLKAGDYVSTKKMIVIK